VANIAGNAIFVFGVRGHNDAHVLLSDDSGTEPYEIVIGGWYNPLTGDSRSMIRRGIQGSNLDVWPNTKNILDPATTRYFWLQMSTSEIVLGKVCVAMPHSSCAVFVVKGYPLLR
jgi:hypothetical protein